MSDWCDIETLALHDPTLYAAVTLVRHGVVSREEALTEVAVVLSEQTKMLQEARLSALSFGIGLVAVTHVSGVFQYRQLDPASVIIQRP